MEGSILYSIVLLHYHMYAIRTYFFEILWNLALTKLYITNKILVSKETVVLHRWEIETEIDFIKRVDKGRITTVKDLESSSERIEELWLL